MHENWISFGGIVIIKVFIHISFMFPEKCYSSGEEHQRKNKPVETALCSSMSDHMANHGQYKHINMIPSIKYLNLL